MKLGFSIVANGAHAAGWRVPDANPNMIIAGASGYNVVAGTPADVAASGDP